MKRVLVIAGCLALAAAAGTSRVEARAQSEWPWSITETFSTAVRFVRIDKGCKIVDKDADAAYVAFECSDDGKTKRGSIELIKAGNGVRAQITLGDDTHGMELRWLELLERKLRDERGTPVPPAPPPPPVAPKDLGV
ncbi:MAG TPA: hypothetical protein VIA18_10880 [Polyangia bacterium]|nr:hypothetical protein [Polyangia bacterium]